MRRYLFILLPFTLMTYACAKDTAGPGADAVDITNAVLSKRAASCTEHSGSYTATINDVGRSKAFTASVELSSGTAQCTLTSNGIPNHDFNEGGSFATSVSEANESFTIPASPSVAANVTGLTLEYDNAIFLNGVKLDLLAAACYGVGSEPLGQEKIGCFETLKPWRYDPMSPKNEFGTDNHNAHTQPDGAYHYHGDPLAMYDKTGATASGVIGFAADGFPIYGPYFDDNGTIRRATSSYPLKSGSRVSQQGEGAFPGGIYDGTYVDDYEYKAGTGDLDECNGMTQDGEYGYYVTDAYPWVLKCFKATPDNSFSKH
jgi:hypothetical protein